MKPFEKIDFKFKQEVDDLKSMIENSNVTIIQKRDMFIQIDRLRNCYEVVKKIKRKLRPAG